MTTITPFLMFEGRAQQAMDLYQACFTDFTVIQCDRYPDDHSQLKGQIHFAIINIHGQQLALIDSPVKHAFQFTPSISLMVEFQESQPLKKAYEQLAHQGEILMPLDQYDFAQQYAWINDPFGVSWQLKMV